MGIIKLRAYLMLFLTALIWGVTFVAQKSAMDHLPPFLFNGIRCLIGAISLFIISFFVKEKTVRKKRRLIRGGITAGVILFVATTVQQAGIVTSSAGHAGFISSLYIVMVPIFSLFGGNKIGKNVWFGVLLATLGLYFLCVKETLEIGKGDLAILFSAIFFALHIMCIAKYSKKTNAIKLSCLQFLFAGVFSTILGLLAETATVSNVISCYKELFYAGILSCAIGYTFQIIAQKHIQPYITSLILSLESVFAAISGCVLLHEVLTAKEVIGCLLMFLAVFAAQIHTKKSEKNSC